MNRRPAGSRPRRSGLTPGRVVASIVAAASVAALSAVGGTALGSDGRSAAVPAPRSAGVPIVASASAPATTGGDATFRSGRAGFAVRVQGLEVPYGQFFVSALPGDTVEISVAGGAPDDRSVGYVASLRRHPLAGGGLDRVGPARWRWIAPRSPGRQRVVVRRLAGSTGVPAASDSIVLEAFVLVPARRLSGGSLDGYRMGTYPTPAYRGLDQYRPPEGFIQLTRENASVRVSPHFTLSQFPVKRPHGWPKYLPLGPRMLLKLELLLEEVNRRGIDAPTFTVMSAYRSPWYNTTLLDRPRYSRHIYGDAADVFIDADGNGYMDDLNGDGRVTVADAQLLYRIVQDMDGSADTGHLKGGLWKYRRTSNHPPFIHVDTRGFIAR